MAFGDEIRGELFNKIGAQDSANPMQKLEQGKNEKAAGNHVKAKEIFEGIIGNSQNKAAQLAQQKQHRAAAEEYYYVYLAHQELGNESERQTVFANVVESLEGASKTAIDFGEDSRGITILTLAGMIALLNNNQDQALQIYNKGMEISNQKQNSQALQKLLYSLGYLLDALKNTNMGALTEAQGFISSDLKPMLKTAKMTTFDHLVESIVAEVGKLIQGEVKMPKIEVINHAPKDLVFNQPYEISIQIENNGEGNANDFNLELDFPNDLELLSGELQKNFGTIEPNAKVNHSLSFRLLTGAGEQEEREISGSFTFTDMLGNGRKQFLSPFDLLFRSVSLTSEYEAKLKAAKETLNVTEEEINEFVPNAMLSQVQNLQTSIKSVIEDALSKEEFAAVDNGVQILEKLSEWSMSNLSDKTGVFKEAIGKMLDDREAKVKQELEEKLKAETDRLTAEHNRSLAELNEKLEREKQRVEEETTLKLSTSHKTEIEKLKAEHNEALQKMEKTVENKLKMQFAQQEEKIRSETQAEIQKKNDEIEKGVRQVQEQYATDKDKELSQLRDELTKKYETEIKNMKGQFESEKQRMTSYAEEDKESALKALQSKLNQEKETALQNLERDLKSKTDHVLSETTGDLKTKHAKEIASRDQKIKELEEKITILESKANK